MALASTALATPAVARDQSWYAGVEGGLLLVEDNEFDVSFTSGGTLVEDDDFFTIEHKAGVDVDLIGGYDFGRFRAEFEAGYKRASVDDLTFGIGSAASDVDGSVRVYSVMANGLIDFGNDADSWNGYFGGGIGLANGRYKLSFDRDNIGASGSDSDRSIAYQAIAGVSKSISRNLDLGLKYRFFVAPKLDYDIIDGEASGRFRSHSLLASLVYNFVPPPPPPVIVAPVAPPPPPATQTCYDGSVILATDTCPQPPVEPAPPPPEPAPERG